MAGEAILELLSATPQEQAALRQIAMLRAQGIDDQTIFAGLGDPAFTQAGGYGFLPYITDMAGISSSYNLGRGNIALQAAADEYQRQGNPYNVVTALQQMRDTGSSAVLTDPVLQNVQQGPASLYSNYLKGLFSDDGAQVAASTGTVANTQNPVAVSQAQQREVQRVRNEVGDQQALQGFQNFANYDAQRQTTPTPTPTLTNAETGAQSAAARLLSGSMRPTSQNAFQSTLASGQIPGFNQINERDFGLLSPDQQASYMGLVGSTGRVSNPMQAYNDFLRKYSQGGTQGARTYR